MTTTGTTILRKTSSDAGHGVRTSFARVSGTFAGLRDRAAAFTRAMQLGSIDETEIGRATGARI